MGYVVSLTGLLPPPRYDTIAWSSVLIQESTGADGPWTQIDAQTLTPVDVNPAAPVLRALSTTKATSASDWFRAVWVDQAGNQALGVPTFVAPGSSQTGAIASVSELKRYLAVSRSTDDQLLEQILRSVSDRVETYCGRAFRPSPGLDAAGNDTLAPVAKTVYPMRHTGAWFPSSYTLLVQIPPTREIDQVTLEGAPVTGYTPVGDPPWTSLQVFDLIYRYYAPSYLQLSTLGPKMVITGRFGWYPPPEDLKDAVLVMAARRYKERDAAYGDAVQLADGGIISYFKQFPPSVQATLDQYRNLAI